MGTYLFIAAPVTVLEQLAGVPAGTHAAIKVAEDAFYAVALSEADPTAWDAASDAYSAALTNIDPIGAYDRIGPFGQGLGKLQAPTSLLERHGLERNGGGTTNADVVREVLDAQRARARDRVVIGGSSDDVTDLNRSFLALIDRLVGELDRGVAFGLTWG